MKKVKITVLKTTLEKELATDEEAVKDFNTPMKLLRGNN
jgi:hypothetical protein